MSSRSTGPVPVHGGAGLTLPWSPAVLAACAAATLQRNLRAVSPAPHQEYTGDRGTSIPMERSIPEGMIAGS